MPLPFLIVLCWSAQGPAIGGLLFALSVPVQRWNGDQPVDGNTFGAGSSIRLTSNCVYAFVLRPDCAYFNRTCSLFLWIISLDVNRGQKVRVSRRRAYGSWNMRQMVVCGYNNIRSRWQSVLIWVVLYQIGYIASSAQCKTLGSSKHQIAPVA